MTAIPAVASLDELLVSLKYMVFPGVESLFQPIIPGDILIDVLPVEITSTITPASGAGSTPVI